MELESKHESIKTELVERSLSPEGKQEAKGEAAPPIRVRGIKQTTNIQFIVEILKKAKTLNYKPQNSEDDIFKIDDFLVEMAVLKTNKKMYSEHVYFFKVKTEKQKWEIRRNYDQFVEFQKKSKVCKQFAVLNEKKPAQEENQLKALEDYLRKVIAGLHTPPDLVKPEHKKITTDERNLALAKLHEFLEYSELREKQGKKLIKLGHAEKRIGGRYKSSKLVQFMKKNLSCCWQPKWFILTDEGIGYTSGQNSQEFRDILFFDTSLQIRHGEKYADIEYGFVLKTSSRKLKIKVKSYLELLDWIQALITSVDRSLYCRPNRYGSFCPISSGNLAIPYIGADLYYADLATALENASHEIYITDWWMSPEVYLRRPIDFEVVKKEVNGVLVDHYNYDTDYRLDQILKRAAGRGCKVFILLYSEFESALPNKSGYTQTKLKNLFKDSNGDTNLDKNIEVVRHPGDLIFLWSHHEKIVVVDQKIVFLGGLDLCYGRYDLPDYPLFEPEERFTKPNQCYFPGQDYSNVRIKDFSDVHLVFEPLIDKNEVPRMPWRDIAMQLRGPVTKDVTRHFIQYWNFAKSDLEGNKRNNFLMKKDFDGVDTKKKNKKSKFEVVAFKKKNKVAPLASPLANEAEETLLLSNREQSADKKEENQPLVQFKLRDDGIFFSEDRLHEADEKRQLTDSSILKQKTSENPLGSNQLLSAILNMIPVLPVHGFNEPVVQDEKIDPALFSCDCQIVRSSGEWSMGLRQGEKERSIQNAYIQMIAESKHFIYIENQFFVSGTAGKPVQNCIADALAKRLERAIEEDNKRRERGDPCDHPCFKLLICLPLLPGFEGEITSKAGNVMRLQLGWLLHTLARNDSKKNSTPDKRKKKKNKDSDLNKKEEEGHFKANESIIQTIFGMHADPFKYIKVIGMRNHGLNKATDPEHRMPCTEQIYIHSKLLIVDDETALIGSANINDRSMMGNRDSEIACITTDMKEVDSKMAGKPYTARHFAYRLRMDVYKSLFGFTQDEEVADPLSPAMWEEIERRTKTNTEVYRNLFGVYPDDLITKTEAVEPFKKMKIDPEWSEEEVKKKKAEWRELYQLEKQKIQGFAVEFPLKFLEEEDLREFKHFEFGLYMLPPHIFT